MFERVRVHTENWIFGAERNIVVDGKKRANSMKTMRRWKFKFEGLRTRKFQFLAIIRVRYRRGRKKAQEQSFKWDKNLMRLTDF